MEKNSKIYISGHKGLAGSAIKRLLEKKGFNNLVYRTKEELDLRDSVKVKEFFNIEKPDYVLVAAARVGGIIANKEKKGEFIYDNLMIQNNILHNSYRNNVKKLIFLSSNCMYPKDAKQPIKEESLFNGKLEESNDAFGVAKIAGVQMCLAYNQQYGTKFIPIVPASMYGINDNFDEENSHFTAALLRRFHEAKEKGKSEVVVWGTGKPRRELLFSDDLAEACLFLMENYDNGLINIGTGIDYEIIEIAGIIKEVVGFKGKIVLDRSKSDGVMRKFLDSSKINNLGWRARTGLREGLEKTYEWYLKASFKNKKK